VRTRGRNGSYERHFENRQITEKLEVPRESCGMYSIVLHGVKSPIGIGLVIANYYLWAVVWNRIVGSMPRS